MFCLSDLLSHIYLQSSTAGSLKARPSIQTHQMVPELIHADPKPYFDLFTQLLSQLVPLCTPGSHWVLQVESLKSNTDLCSVKFDFNLNTQCSEVECAEHLKEFTTTCNHLGAWLELAHLNSNVLQLSIEMNLRAKSPDPAWSIPSWLYSKPTTLITWDNSKHSACEDLLCNMGAMVSRTWWSGIKTIDDLAASIRRSDNRNLYVVDLDSPKLETGELIDILQAFTKSGLLAGQVEFLLLINPKHAPHIPAHIANHIGYKLLKAPLTSHRLINPKSTLMASHSLATQALNNGPVNELNVLLVEDCDLTRRLIRGYLEDKGMRVLEAADGETALVLANESKFDTVLMDLDLPGLSGFQTATHLREREEFSQTPIIAISASRDLDDFRRCYTHGMDDCISKPLYLNEVVKRIVGWAQMSHQDTMVNALI